MSYSLSKAGLYWLTITLAQALSPRIRVNAVAPGPTLINARQSRPISPVSARRRCWAAAPSRRTCAMPCAIFWRRERVTGQTIAVDGGQHLIWQTPDVQREGMT